MVGIVGGGDETHLERRRCDTHPLVEQRVEVWTETFGIGCFHVGIVLRRTLRAFFDSINQQEDRNEFDTI